MFQTSFNGKRKGFLLVRRCTSKASTGRFHFVVQRSRTRTIMKGPKKCEVFFSFKLSLYRWFCFPKNQIQNKRNYQVLSPTGEPQYNEGPRDWQTLFAITRFRYIEVLFHVFCYYWGNDNRSLYWGLYMEVQRLYRGSTVKKDRGTNGTIKQYCQRDLTGMLHHSSLYIGSKRFMPDTMPSFGPRRINCFLPMFPPNGERNFTPSIYVRFTAGTLYHLWSHSLT